LVKRKGVIVVLKEGIFFEINIFVVLDKWNIYLTSEQIFSGSIPDS
jgi:hypothetical protein